MYIMDSTMDNVHGGSQEFLNVKQILNIYTVYIFEN